MTIKTCQYHRRDTSERATYLNVLSWMIEHSEEKHTRVSDNPNGSFWMDVNSSDHRTVSMWQIPVSHRAIVVRFSPDGTVTLYPRRRLRCTNPGASSEYNYSTTIGRKTYRTLPTTLHYTGGDDGNSILIHAWYVVDHSDPDDKAGYYAPIHIGNDPFSPVAGWHYYGDESPAHTIDWVARQLDPSAPLPAEVFARHSHCHPWTLPHH